MQRTGSGRWPGFAVGLIGLGALAGGGCGSSNPNMAQKTVFQGPQEVDQKKSDLFDAMKGGAYGSAGRKSAPTMDPTKK